MARSPRRRVPSADEVFDALLRSFDDALAHGRVREVRRDGDDAVFLLTLGRHRPLFGVGVPLTSTERRLDWDHPAADLDDWLESVELWLLEDVENWYASGATRTQRADHIELGLPAWSGDPRFDAGAEAPEEVTWLRHSLVSEADPATWRRIELALAAGDLLSVVHVHDAVNGDTVGLAMVRRQEAGAELADVWLEQDAPAGLVLELVRTAIIAAAASGLAYVVTRSSLPHLDVLGFRALPDGSQRVDTDLLDQDLSAAAALVEASLDAGGDWGKARDQAGRVLPGTARGRWWHRLRHGPSGAPRRFTVA